MKKIIKILILIIALFLISISIYNLTSNKNNTYHFCLQEEYVSQTDLYNTLFEKGVNSSDNLFLWCCDTIMYYGREFNISYGMMNLLIFVIFQPLIILILLIWVVRKKREVRQLKQKIKRNLLG